MPNRAVDVSVKRRSLVLMKQRFQSHQSTGLEFMGVMRNKFVVPPLGGFHLLEPPNGGTTNLFLLKSNAATSERK